MNIGVYIPVYIYEYIYECEYLGAAHVPGPEGLVRREERVYANIIYIYLLYTSVHIRTPRCIYTSINTGLYIRVYI